MHARSRRASRFRAVGAYMAFLATLVAPPHWGTTLALALLPSPPAVVAEPPPTPLVPLPPLPCFLRRPPFPVHLPFQPSLAGPAYPWLSQPRQEQQLCVLSCPNSATHNRDFRGAPLATDYLYLQLATYHNLVVNVSSITQLEKNNLRSRRESNRPNDLIDSIHQWAI